MRICSISSVSWVTLCGMLLKPVWDWDTTIDEIIEMNVDKLKARYPGGEF